jgi:hypothetical protein
VAEALAADEGRVFETTAEEERVLVRRVVERIEDERAIVSKQVPKAGLQPVPQRPMKDELTCASYAVTCEFDLT